MYTCFDYFFHSVQLLVVLVQNNGPFNVELILKEMYQPITATHSYFLLMKPPALTSQVVRHHG